jgi:hypothetical protein
MSCGLFRKTAGTITEGSELVAQLDTFALSPDSQFTRVYDVPATKLTLFADAGSGTGTDAFDELVLEPEPPAICRRSLSMEVFRVAINVLMAFCCSRGFRPAIRRS